MSLLKMDLLCGNLTSSEGLQDWFTDLDAWICKFDAQIKTTRFHRPDEKEIVDNFGNQKFSTEEKITQNRPSSIQPSSVAPVTLHEIFVNGLLVAKKDTFRNNIDFFNILKATDFVYYDYVLLMLLKENGRKHVYKYTRSKI